MTPGGRATVVYLQATTSSPQVKGRVRHANGTWEAVKALSDSPGGIAVAPRVAAGAQAATAAWVRADGDGDWRVESRPWVPFSWRPYTVLSADDASTDTFDVAMEQFGGEALAVWRQFDGAVTRVASSAGS
jgi:hypothetical protein